MDFLSLSLSLSPFLALFFSFSSFLFFPRTSSRYLSYILFFSYFFHSLSATLMFVFRFFFTLLFHTLTYPLHFSSIHSAIHIFLPSPIYLYLPSSFFPSIVLFSLVFPILNLNTLFLYPNPFLFLSFIIFLQIFFVPYSFPLLPPPLPPSPPPSLPPYLPQSSPRIVPHEEVITCVIKESTCSLVGSLIIISQGGFLLTFSFMFSNQITTFSSRSFLLRT